jgi:TonB family protein
MVRLRHFWHDTLLRALLLSGVLHLLIMVAPYLGENIDSDRPADASAARRQPVLTASLVHSRKLGPTMPAIVLAPKAPQAIPFAPQKNPAADVPLPGIPDEVPLELNPTEGLALLPIPGVVYYAINELTSKPQPLGESELDPKETAAIVASGKIVLVLWINAQGEVADVTVERSDLPEVFVKAATKAFQKLRFSPGELNGQKVGAVMRIEVSYDDGRAP